MLHFVEIYTSEGFAWGVLAGLAASILTDFFVAYMKGAK